MRLAGRGRGSSPLDQFLDTKKVCQRRHTGYQNKFLRIPRNHYWRVGRGWEGRIRQLFEDSHTLIQCS
jgi:hypothetical protein